MSRYLLITDVQYRKAFDIISMIKKTFPKEHLLLASIKWVSFNILCYGACATEWLRTEEGEEAFDEDFSLLLKKYAQDELIYIPVEEQTTDYVINYVEKHGEKNLKYLLPSAMLYKTFRNKKKLSDYCQCHGFPAPREFDVRDLPDVEYPVLLKPEIGSGSHGIYRLYGKEDYNEEVRTAVVRKNYLIQELLPNGKEVRGAFFLCHEGKVVGAYTHKRIRTSPEEGGVTVLSSIDDNQELIKQGKELLEHVGWEGLVMLEYIYDDKSSQYKVIEANPRLWGSVMLSEYSGANLLSNYVRICLGQQILQQKLRRKAYVRWFFPMDIVAWLKKKGRIKSFWNFKDTCFINWTYARKDRAVFFLLFSIFNNQSIKKLLHRV